MFVFGQDIRSAFVINPGPYRGDPAAQYLRHLPGDGGGKDDKAWKVLQMEEAVSESDVSVYTSDVLSAEGDVPCRRCRDTTYQDELDQFNLMLKDLKSTMKNIYDDVAADDDSVEDSEWTKVKGGMNLD